MKLKTLIIALFVLGLGASCSQQVTCPTYAKEDVKETKTTETERAV